MFKKFNWGWGLALFYTGFVCFMLCMVWCCNLMPTELVTADYYGKELKYQEQLNKTKRGNLLSGPVSWIVMNKKVQLTFPPEVKSQHVKADILFYRPDNSHRDFSISCNADTTGVCVVGDSEKFKHGVYKMQVEWKTDSDTYYTEGVIKIK